jgi:short-subunit dehydrogenase
MNKLIVVTGGTRGIGRSIVEKFLHAGFDVATCGRNQKDLSELISYGNQKFPTQKIHSARADLSVQAEAKDFGDYVNALNIPVDILINNAGYFLPGELVTEPEDTLESMINANLYSAYHLTRKLAPKMIEKKSGHIFNMCSIASIKAYANGGSYAISKFALLGFSKCLREELKQFGIRVTAVMPGATFTASWEGAGIPEERFIKPEDVADTVFAAYTLSVRSVVEEIILRPQAGDI